MSDQPSQRNQLVRSIMPAVEGPVRKREREPETIESPEETGSNGLATPNGAAPSNGTAGNANGNGTQDGDKPIKPHKPLNRVPRMLFYARCDCVVPSSSPPLPRLVDPRRLRESDIFWHTMHQLTSLPHIRMPAENKRCDARGPTIPLARGVGTLISSVCLRSQRGKLVPQQSKA